MAEPYKATVKPIKGPKHGESDLLNVIPIGDSHVGMFAWKPETGESFDLKIVERNTVNAIASVLKSAPKAEHCCLINVGDYFHEDGRGTTTKGTPVDTDGRWPKVVEVGLRIFRKSIDLALKTHKRVTVICAIGNHDAQISVLLATMLSLMYERENRVTINTAPTKHHYLSHGKCLFGVTHGDTGKQADLPLIMAGDRPQEWADSVFRHWYCGHVHHDTVKEYRGCTVETVRTLAPADKWHVGQGYKSGRDIKCDTWHKEYGRINRITRNIVQIEAESKK
jgi:hypothetical protein